MKEVLWNLNKFLKKPELLLVANMPIYLNISSNKYIKIQACIKKIHDIYFIK